MKTAAPTMKDVAQEAGVALGTVSKVMNGLPVGESYRVRVEIAAKKLGYQVNQYARGLKTNETRMVAVILPGVDHPFFSLLAQQICEALARREYRMVLYVTASRPDRERECVRLVRQNKADGIIGLTYNMQEVEEDLPFISIDRCFSPAVPCVAADNYGGGRMAAEKLLELGSGHLAFLRTGSPYPSETDKRGDGFAMVCQTRGVPYEVLRIDDGADIGQFRTFLGCHKEVDGIFCATDLLAWQVRRMLEEIGARVPEDVQIIGFDGIRRFGGEELYGSTIVQPVAKIAETSVELLLKKDRSHIPALVCLPVTYAPGGTTREEERHGE